MLVLVMAFALSVLMLLVMAMSAGWACFNSHSAIRIPQSYPVRPEQADASGLTVPALSADRAVGSPPASPPVEPAVSTHSHQPNNATESEMSINRNRRRQAMIDLLLDAIREVESGGDCQAVGKANERGPYQITPAYWSDACEYSHVQLSYGELVESDAHCRAVIVWYFKRYAREAYDQLDLEILARIHNGGPAGVVKDSTGPYWRKVVAAMDAASPDWRADLAAARRGG
jgi:hypothetical protein